jgi:hypothetical protein
MRCGDEHLLFYNVHIFITSAAAINYERARGSFCVCASEIFSCRRYLRIAQPGRICAVSVKLITEICRTSMIQRFQPESQLEWGERAKQFQFAAKFATTAQNETIASECGADGNFVEYIFLHQIKKLARGLLHLSCQHIQKDEIRVSPTPYLVVLVQLRESFGRAWDMY